MNLVFLASLGFGFFIDGLFMKINLYFFPAFDLQMDIKFHINWVLSFRFLFNFLCLTLL